MKICVFCASSNALAPQYYKLASEIGQSIGSKGHELVYGGSNVGLMEELSSSVKEAGGKITGIIPHKMKEKGLASSNADELIVTPDMSQRKHKMEELAEAFIALPGGFGTLEEILEVITLKQLQYHNKPVVLINYNGFYDELLVFFDRMYRDNFAKLQYKDYYQVVTTAAEALEYIENYRATEATDKWYNVQADEFRKKA